MQSSGLLFVDPQNILLYGQSIPPAFLATVAAWLSPALSLPSVQLSSGLFANTLIDISINRNTQMWMCRPVFMTTYRNTHRRDLYLRLPWQCRFGVLVTGCTPQWEKGCSGRCGGVNQQHTAIWGAKNKCFLHSSLYACSEEVDSSVHLCMYQWIYLSNYW